MATALELIKGETLTGTAASYTFTAIPSTYTDLLLKISAKTGYGGIDYFTFRLNGNTSGVYSETRMVAYGGTGTLSDRYSSQTSIQDISLSGDNANSTSIFSNTDIYIPNYAAAEKKQISVSGVVIETTTTENQILADACSFNSSVAITSISFAPTYAASFLADSSFYLYGVKNA